MIGKPQINTFENVEKVCLGFTIFFQDLLKNTTGDFNIALSGGSTPKALFKYWSSQPDLLDWERLRFFWGDERCVLPTDQESNFGMTKALLFDPLNISNEQIFRIEGENEPATEAERYGQILQQQLFIKEEIPAFDLLMLGMGDDGHTASIFPHEFDLWSKPENCVVATHPITRQKRVSITGKIIKNAKQVAFLVTGANKAAMLEMIFNNPSTSSEKYPAARVNQENPNTHWFLDHAASKLLV